MTPSKSSEETAADTQNATNNTLANTNQAQVIANNADLNGAVQDTDYYKDEVKSGTAATTEGYDASAKNMKASMEAAGVSGRSGVASGNETALEAGEASALSSVKTNAYADTNAQKLAANQQALTASGQQSGAATTDLGTANNAEEQRQSIGQKNWAALGSAVTSAAAPFTAGASKALFGSK